MELTRRIGISIALASAALLALAGPAAAREARMAVDTPVAAGPAEYNKVFVDQYGPKNAKHVLVLMPGTVASSGNFTLDARYLVKNVPNLQVWAIDRRSNALEDTSYFTAALNGQKSLQEMFDYYLGFLDGATPPSHINFRNGFDYPYVREWGMATALNDARAVVLKARAKGKRKVVLGGHSLGASLAVAYSAWDFNGRPGYKDIEGIVAMDGGLRGSFNSIDSLADAQAKIGQLQSSNPFADLLGIGIPEVTGIFAEVGGIYAKLQPTAPATTLQGFTLLPPMFNPPFPVTNRGLFGYAFDRDTSPASLSLIHTNAGALAPAGSPRDWVDGGVTPIDRLASSFGQEPANGVEWYFPRRLTIDTDAASPMVRNEASDFLGLRLFHSKQVDDPLYVIQSDLSNGSVLQGGRNFIRRARTTRKESMLVNADPQNAHLDSLIAAPKTNLFLKTVPNFLGDVFAQGNKRAKRK